MLPHRLLLLALLLSCGCASSESRRFDEIDYGMGEERDVVVNGVRLRVREGGKAGAPTLLLLHCFGLTMKVWRDLVPALEERYHVVAYDALGHGKSDMGVRRLDLDQLAHLGLGLMDRLGIESATVVGNSMGGGTALGMALLAPERTDALVLIDSVGLHDDEWFIPLWPLVSPRHVGTAAPWTWRAAYALAMQKRSPLGDEILEDILATRSDPLADRNAAAMWTVVDAIFKTDRTDDLPAVRAPTLVLAGRHDRLVTVDHAERLSRGIPGARLHVFEDLGHLPEIEDAGAVAAVMLPFLEEALTTGQGTLPQGVGGATRTAVSSPP